MKGKIFLVVVLLAYLVGVNILQAYCLLRTPRPLAEVRWPMRDAWRLRYGDGTTSQLYYDVFILGELVKVHAKRLTALEDKLDPNGAAK